MKKFFKKLMFAFKVARTVDTYTLECALQDEQEIEGFKDLARGVIASEDDLFPTGMHESHKAVLYLDLDEGQRQQYIEQGEVQES